MDKIVIEVFVPAANECFDVKIPLELKVWEIIALLVNALEDLTDGRFSATEQTTLCDRETGAILNMNITAEELGIRNGSKLMLI